MIAGLGTPATGLYVTIGHALIGQPYLPRVALRGAVC